MAVYDLQEQEQIDALKAWWQDNRKFVFGIATAAIVGLAGYQGWKFWKNDQAAKAALVYEQLQQAIKTSQTAGVMKAKQQLQADFADNAFASRGILLAATYEQRQSKLADAARDLEWIVANSKELPLQDIARLRLAAVKLDDKKFDEGISALGQITTDGLKGLVSFQKAELFAAKGDPAAAKSAYRLAFEQLDQSDPLRAVVEMKLDALGGK